MRIDAHQHFWRYSAADYPWIDDGLAAIRRDFLPTDLAATLAPCGIAAAVAVQARQSLEETAWLLAMAHAAPKLNDTPLIAGVVGWLPLRSPDIAALLALLAADPLLRGVRHVVQDEDADALLADPAFENGIRALLPHGLAYDLLLREHQLRAATAFVDRHPRQVFVLDHLAKPGIRAGRREPWATDLRALAKRPNVWCKLSGLASETGAGWTADDLRFYVTTALKAFGPHRLLYGSDWPVCLSVTTYARWLATVEELLAGLSANERAAVFGGNAITAYGLSATLPPATLSVTPPSPAARPLESTP